MKYETGRFYGLQEISTDLRIPKSSLSRWCREGRLPGKLFGKKWMLDGAAVEEMRENGVPDKAKGATEYDFDF